ncbi:MAG: hypothetical protein ACM31C_14545 [Acidobacteriota bacterium]
MRTAFFALLLASCGGDSGSTSCTTTQAEVRYFGGSADGRSECKPIPAACGGSASCAAQACISALYDLCAAPYIGVGCSDTYPPTIVSCNP